MSTMALLPAILAVLNVATAATITTSEPSLPEIQAAQATTLPETTNSDVGGVAFDRFYQIWLENIVRSRSGVYDTSVCC